MTTPFARVIFESEASYAGDDGNKRPVRVVIRSRGRGIDSVHVETGHQDMMDGQSWTVAQEQTAAHRAVLGEAIVALAESFGLVPKRPEPQPQPKPEEADK